jgi:hypothetical protein
MMKITIVFFLCLLMQEARAQYLKVDNSILVSSFSNKENLPNLSSDINSYSVQVGVDYLEKKWFSLSSQAGYMQIGGRETNNLLPQPEFKKVTERKEYIQFNTTFRPHIQTSKSTLFVGVGPTVSLLAGDKRFQSPLYENYHYNRLRFGGKAELGITQDIKKFRFGLVGAYLLDFSPAAKSEFLSLYNNAFAVAITTGYRLK